MLRGKTTTKLRVLVIDIGGSHIKVREPGTRRIVTIDSGPEMTPQKMVHAVKETVEDDDYDVVSIGYPGTVRRGVPCEDPPNLGKGWVKFNFARVFQCPVKVINDAALQALGSYHGGKMLFLGLGTGLGSAIVLEGVPHAMELGDLPYRKVSCSEYVKKDALKRLGVARWSRHVNNVIQILDAAIQPDYTVIGGGQAKRVRGIPRRMEVVDNSKAFLGGERLWQPPARFWDQQVRGS